MDSKAAGQLETNALAIVAAVLMVASVACGEVTNGGDDGGNAANGNARTAPGLVGTWRGATTMGCLGTVTDEIVFSPNGTFSRLTASSETNCVPGTLMVHITGNYKVDSNLKVIHFTQHGHRAQAAVSP